MENKEMINKFLFVLAAPYSGSTALTSILATSKNVSLNNPNGKVKEGHLLPGVKELMFIDDRWEVSAKIPWFEIKKLWFNYWDTSKPILLDKSPPNLVRAMQITKHFNPSYFICLVRNPYAHVHGIIRRGYYKGDVIEASKFVISCYRYQKYNLETLNHSVLLTYEQLCDDRDQTSQILSSLLNELSDVNLRAKVEAHNIRKTKLRLTNLNDEKISLLTIKQIIDISKVLEDNKDILDYFNYNIIN